MDNKWTEKEINSLKGKVVVITGANSGLGKETATIMAAKGAQVIMAVRNIDKSEPVKEEISSKYPESEVYIRQLDLASLDNIREFATRFQSDFGRLDILFNNAGVMACPYGTTEDGLEIQMGVNHFGHFALTGLLMPILRNTLDSRIVVLSSLAHQTGDIDFQDINWKKRSYKTNKAYADSKLANLYFTYEFAERYKDDSSAPKIIAAHPGWTRTSLIRHSGMMNFIGVFIGQHVDMGVLPSLRAAIDEDLVSGDYIGPDRFAGMRGYPKKVESNKRSRDRSKANKLWNMSIELTGVNFN